MSLALLADSPCADCGALLDQGQRYCIHCGRRRTEVEDPAVSYLAETRARQATTAVAAGGAVVPPPRNPLALPALALAILPVAVGVGVLIGGRSNGPDQEQLLQALRSQKAPVVKVGNVAGGTAVASTASKKSKAPSSKAKKGKIDATGSKVIGKTAYGVVHQVSGFKPTAAKVKSDQKLVQRINDTIGKDYLSAQKNLPDTIVVSPGSGGNTSGPSGRGD